MIAGVGDVEGLAVVGDQARAVLDHVLGDRVDGQRVDDAVGGPDRAVLDQVAVDAVVSELAGHIGRLKPQVVVTFGGDGVYGHPDHIAISQFATAATVQAARTHQVDKLYYMAWSEAMQAAYLEVFSGLGSTVDGVTRRQIAWPDWMLTATIDAREHWQTVWTAVRCHESQITSYEHLEALSAAQHMALWGRQWFYRVFSRVNGGRAREDDLFAGLR